MSGIDERPGRNELYLRILYFSNLDAVVSGLVDDVIPPQTVVIVQRPYEGATQTEWHRTFLNVRRVARMGRVQLVEGYDELRRLFNYHDAGRQYMLW